MNRVGPNRPSDDEIRRAMLVLQALMDADGLDAVEVRRWDARLFVSRAESQPATEQAQEAA